MFEFPPPHKKVLPHDIKITRPSSTQQDPDIQNRIIGSLIGLAVGDALGASVEFRPRQYLLDHPIEDMMSGGTWGLRAGQWTDDTSMALCLASSLLVQQGFNSYDQMVRYKWWYKNGYLSSTGHCFDIGNATRSSLDEFYRRQTELKKKFKLSSYYDVDLLPLETIEKEKFNVYCSRPGVAGNGALMRLAPVPLFFYQAPIVAVELSGQSARLTHGDDVAVDACRYYGALIVAAVRRESKEELLSGKFCENHQEWFGSVSLQDEIVNIAKGSFKRPKGYEDGIRGKGHIVWTLEAALWAFWKTDSFEKGVLAAVNLGDDTDTTAAIYGQLAGAYYGCKEIPEKWVNKLYAKELIECVAKWIQCLGYTETKESEHQAASRDRFPIADASQKPVSKIRVLSKELHIISDDKSKPNSHKSRSKSAQGRTKAKAERPHAKDILPRCIRPGLRESDV